MKINLKIRFALIAIGVILSVAVSAQKFIHPGINQTPEDMAYMKSQVLAGAQPWKDAFDRLKANTDLTVVIEPFTHVKRGPYGKPNIGYLELARDVNMAYDCALLWYITDNKSYAEKSVGIINAWSLALWDFDYNDAKLMAAWTGHKLCNAAEILRYSKSGWQQKDIESFKNMLMTVYYPLIRYYYPQANGNWDGAIINSILAIAVFTDNKEMFENGVDHFLHGPVNGSIFKYIYPSGQCQESIRDQGHVQLGLDEFSGAARVALTQGVDLFSIGNNRIALGYEYTSKFLLGETPHCYGVISQRAKSIRDNIDNCEYVYRHYTSKGISVPYTKNLADSLRIRSHRNTLTAFRAPSSKQALPFGTPKVSSISYPAGAMASVSVKPPAGSVFVDPGQSIQEALNSIAGTNKWVVVKAGIHTFNETLKIPSGVTLAGEGLSTILFLDPASGLRDAIVNEETTMHDVTIRDFVLEGNTKTDYGTDPNSSRSYRNPGIRGGIMFAANKEGDIRNINLVNLTVQNCTYNGVFLNGITGLEIICCDFNECGSSVVPGPKLQHNLLLTHCADITVKDCRLDTSPYGSGISLDHCSDVIINNCEVARNAYYGILIAESHGITITGNLIEGNDRSGIMAEFLFRGSDEITITNNQVQYNNGYGIESYGATNIKAANNNYSGNGNNKIQQKLSDEKIILMQ